MINKYFNLILLVISILTGCVDKKNTNIGRKIFRYNESKGIESLDPAFARNQARIWAVNQLYNGLLQLDDSLNVIPCIAKKYSVSNNGLCYTFYLRTDVFFHVSPVFPSGKSRKVTAYDVEYSFKRILNPKLASPGVWVFNFVNQLQPNTSKGFKILNDSVIEIYLKQPFPAFASLLTMPYCFIVPREAIEMYGLDFRNHPVGTGPFCFKKWVEGEKLVFVKNKRYFETDSLGKKLPRIDAVAITFIPDKQSEFLEFIKGRIDFISGVNAQFKDELITRNGKLNPKYFNKINMLTSPYLNTEYIGMLVDTTLNVVKNSPVKFKNVRKALNLAIDREKMVTYLRNNIGIPAIHGFVPAGIPYYNIEKIDGFKYNPDSARKLLLKSGFKNGIGLAPLKITTVSDYLDICEFVQHELSQIGISVDVEVVTGLAYREMLANSRLPMFRASWVGDYANAENFMSLFYSPNFCPSGPNYTHFSNKNFDQLYTDALNEADFQNRNNLYAEMDNLVLNEAVIIPLFYDKVVRFTNKKVKCLGINPMNLLSLKFVDFY